MVTLESARDLTDREGRDRKNRLNALILGLSRQWESSNRFGPRVERSDLSALTGPATERWSNDVFVARLESEIVRNLGLGELEYLNAGLAREVLQRLRAANEGRPFVEESPGAFWARTFGAAGLLIKLGGALYPPSASEGANGRASLAARQDLSVRLLIDAAARSLESQRPPTLQGLSLLEALNVLAQSYNRAARGAAVLAPAVDEVDRALRQGKDVLVQVSRGMADGGALSASEKTQLDVLRELDRRLSGGVENEWKGAVVLLLDEGVHGNYEDVVRRLSDRVRDGLGQKGGLSLGLAAWGRGKTMEAVPGVTHVRQGSKTIIQGAEVLRLGRGLHLVVGTIFALREDGVEWNLKGVEELAAFIVSLAGGLVKNMTAAVGEDISRIRYLEIQA